MIGFILVLLLTIAGIAGVIFAGTTSNRAIGAVVGAIGAIALAVMGTTTVPARSIGIEQSVGRFSDTLTPGVHLVAPWASVESWSTRNQTIRFEAGGQKESDRDNFDFEDRLAPKLANQADAYVEGTFSWTVASTSDADQKAKIKSLWQQYPSFDDMRHDFVVPAAVSAVSSSFDVYNPLSAITPIAMQPATQPSATAPAGFIPLTEWSKRVTAVLKPAYSARGIDLVSVQITRVAFDGPTEDKIKAFNDAGAETKIAAQQVETAKQQALATAARNNSTQVGKGCEALIRDLAAQHQLDQIAPGNLKCSDDPGGQTGSLIVDGRK